MYLFIAGINKSAYLVRNSVVITDELQERTNKSYLDLTYKPSEMQDVRLFDGFPILSSGANYVVLNATYGRNYNSLFRPNDKVYVAIGLGDEETVTVSTVTNSAGFIKLTMTANFTAVPVITELCGILKFAGNVSDVEDRNIVTLRNIQYRVNCIDYTRIFDKKLVNESYTSKDSRYIINDFCNATINRNAELDSMDYATDGAIQAEWIESGDGSNPTTDLADYQEGTGSGLFSFVFSGGTATFSATPTSANLQAYTGVANGLPTKGVLGLWYKCTDYTKVTSIKARIGSSSGNYAEVTVVPISNSWTFAGLEMKNASVTGTPDWTATDYLAIVIAETASSSVRFDGFRVLESGYFRHYPNVSISSSISNFTVLYKKPTEVMQRLADELGYYWYVDYEKNIYLSSSGAENAPFEVTESSDNFDNLNISYDSSRLANRQIVEGGEETSTSEYSEVKEGDSVMKEWIAKTKFKNLIVQTDRNTSTDTTEAGTNTTNIKATAHGLLTGDYIVNRSRSNAVRKITWVNADNFTVDTVTAQTSGDTFSKFVTKAVGYEGIDIEAGMDYMANYTQKSIRNSSSEAVLTAAQFILFRYNEVIPIIVIRRNSTSISSLISVLGYTDGIFDGQRIIDKTIKSRAEATALANAYLTKWSNMIITARFTTYEEGLSSGQLIHIKDTSSGTRNIDQLFLIQQVISNQVESGVNSYSVTCSSLLFGFLELLQQLLKQGRAIEVDEDAVINNLEDFDEDVTVTDSLTTSKDGNKYSETCTVTDGLATAVILPPFKWCASGTKPLRWNQGSWA